MIETKDRKGWGRIVEETKIHLGLSPIITMKITRPKYIFPLPLGVWICTSKGFHICAPNIDHVFNFFSEAAILRSFIMLVSNLSSLYVNLAPIFRHSFD